MTGESHFWEEDVGPSMEATECESSAIGILDLQGRLGSRRNLKPEWNLEATILSHVPTAVLSNAHVKQMETIT